jgi:Caspase domain
VSPGSTDSRPRLEQGGTAEQALAAITVPSSQATIAFLLGASQFPRSGNRQKELSAPPSFKQSAGDFAEYLASDKGLRLRSDDDICDLFDFEGSPAELCDKAARFAHSRAQSARDVIVYYVGHGTVPQGNELHVAIRHTDDRFDDSNLSFRNLASALRYELRAHRMYFILDCCFAGAAAGAWMSGGLESAVTMMSRRLPSIGVAMLCATSADERAWAPKDQVHTMFSGALLSVLKGGVKGGPLRFSLSVLRDETRTIIQERFPDKEAWPHLHQPDQRDGDVALVELFPNPARRQAFGTVGQWQHTMAERQVRSLLKMIESLQAAIEKFPSSYNIERFSASLLLEADGSATLERECFGITADQPVTGLEIPYKVEGGKDACLHEVECREMRTSKLKAAYFDLVTPTESKVMGVVRLSGGELSRDLGFVGYRVSQRIDNSFSLTAEALGQQLGPGDFPWDYFVSEIVTPMQSITVIVNLPPSFKTAASAAEPVVFFGDSETLNFSELERIEVEGNFRVQGRTAELSLPDPKRGNRYGIAWLPPSASQEAADDAPEAAG